MIQIFRVFKIIQVSWSRWNEFRYFDPGILIQIIWSTLFDPDNLIQIFKVFNIIQVSQSRWNDLYLYKNDVKSWFHLDREAWMILNTFNIWIKLSGSKYLDQNTWIKIYGSNYLDQFYINFHINFHINFIKIIDSKQEILKPSRCKQIFLINKSTPSFIFYGTKVMIEKSRGEGCLMEQPTIENVS